MIKIAIEETQMQISNNSSVNCPDNHNHNKKGASKKIKVVRTDNSLRLKIIKDDFVMPHKSVKVGYCYKKNQTWGKEKRYLMLGAS